jgi:hypothetical protein
MFHGMETYLHEEGLCSVFRGSEFGNRGQPNFFRLNPVAISMSMITIPSINILTLSQAHN